MNTRSPGLLAASLLGVVGLLAAPSAAAHEGADGKISHKRNEVRSQPEPNISWHDAEIGELLYQQGRVNTMAESTAAVVFRDDSNVSMRANTLLIVYGHHALRDRKQLIAMDANLERGALRARLGELEGNPDPRRAEIGTPGAETELAGGNALLKVDDEGTSRIHNHGEGETTVKAKTGGKTKVDKGMGVKVQKARRAAKPIPLPPTPSWVAGPEIFLGVSGRLSELRGGWGPVAKAESYYIEVAADREGVDVFSAFEVPKTVESFEVHGLLPGSYHVRVAAVDDDQFESIPSAPRTVELVAVELAGPQGLAPIWPEDGGLNPVPQVLPGTRLVLPANIRCGASLDALEAAPIFVTGGIHELACQNDAGAAVAAFPVEVPQLDPGVAEAGALREAVEVTRGVRSTRDLIFDTDMRLPETLHVRAPAGVEIEKVEPTGPGSWRVTLLADDSAAANAELELSFLPTSDDGPDTTFATVPLTIIELSDDASATKTELEPELHMLELGVAGGAVVFARDHGLYDPSLDHQALRRPAGELVFRVGYYPGRWAGIELAGRVIPGRTADTRTRATATSFRAQLVGQLDYRVTPFIAGGIESLGVSSPAEGLGRDTDIGAVLGGGLKFFVTKDILLRLGAAAMFHEGYLGQTVAHAEVELGVGFVLGRRSAGRPTAR